MYLDLLKPLHSLWLIEKLDENLPIKFVQFLGIPFEIQSQKGVANQVNNPVPEWLAPKVEHHFILLAFPCEFMPRKLQGIIERAQGNQMSMHCGNESRCIRPDLANFFVIPQV